MAQQKNQVVYFENLDSLRAIAAMLVVFYHLTRFLKFPRFVFSEKFLALMSFNGQGGSIGVTFFFTLSGFLITYLMFSEQEKTGTFNIKHFYFRRLLRIWPLYYLTIFIGFILIPTFFSSNELNPQHQNFWYYIFYLSNFDHITNPARIPPPLGVQWSVAIEEQFYLVWPLLFSFIPIKHFPYFLIILTAVSFAFFFWPGHWKVSYYHTISNVRFLSAGALMAFFAFKFKPVLQLILIRLSAKFLWVIYISGLLMLFFSRELSGLFIFMKFIMPALSVLFFLFVIAEQSFSPSRRF